MSKYFVGIVMSIFLFLAAGMAYKTMQLRESVLGLSLSIAELDLATTEFSCDIERVHAYEAGYAKGVQEANYE